LRDAALVIAPYGPEHASGFAKNNADPKLIRRIFHAMTAKPKNG
jgi:hypothetical protein